MAGQTIQIQPDEFTKVQHQRLGVVSPDDWGRMWSYVAFSPGTYRPGRVVRDVPPSALVSATAGVGTVTQAQAVDTNQLQDTGEFANDGFLRGAIGQIIAGGGVGQVFQVIKRIDDNTLEIALINDGSGDVKGGHSPGWEVALTTSSTYQLRLPGRVSLGIAATLRKRGVFQGRKNLVVPANEERYGWVLQRGDGFGYVDEDTTSDADAGTADDLLTTAADGELTNDGATASNTVGYLTHQIANNTERLTRVHFTIVNNELSYRFENKYEPYAKDDRGNLIL